MKNHSILPILVSFACLMGCASTNSASYYFAQKQLANRDINFHETLRINEYLNAFPQDWLRVNGNADVILRVDPLTSIQPQRGENTLYQIAVKSRRLTKEEAAKPVAVSFVIDTSGSMQGGNMDDAKHALAEAIKEMKEGNVVSIVTFSNEAQVLVSNLKINKPNRKLILKQIEQIEADAGTNIEAGLIDGYRELAKFPAGINKRVLLLTDGRSTVDTLTPAQIAQKAAVEYMEDARISTIGLGHNVDAGLLRKIAKVANGHYYFADTSKTLTKILREDLQSTVVPIAKNVELELTLGESYEWVKVYGGDVQTDNASPTQQLNLGELNVDDWRIILVELKKVSDDAPSFNVTGHYESFLSTQRHQLVPDTNPLPNTETLNQYVLRNATLFANAQALIEASRLYNQHQGKDAIAVLDLQIQNNQVLATMEDSEMLRNERTTLSKTRNIIATNLNLAPATLTKAKLINPEQPKRTSIGKLVANGIKLVADVLPGLWSTLARCLAAIFD